MTDLYDPRSAMLAGLPDDREYILEFSEEVFVVTYFDHVDYTIYDRGDVMTSDVIEKLKGDIRFLTAGTIVQFNVGDISSVIERKSGAIVYTHHLLST